MAWMMKVREAGQEDVERLIEFLHKAWKEAGPGALGWTGATEETIRHIASYGFLSNLLEREDTRVFIAHDDGRVVGFASNRMAGDGLVELSGIVVLESLTGVGIGGRLLEHSIEAAKEDGCTEMVVKTESFNERAVNFYLRKGFRSEATVEEEVEGSKVELVELVLTL
jgi:ribosomal protein S18 acetylase RimI-like enzyme